jgi:hypothetical protein
VGQRATGNGIFEYNIWYIHIHWSILFSYYNNNPCNCITYIYIHIYMWLYIYILYTGWCMCTWGFLMFGWWWIMILTLFGLWCEHPTGNP